MSNGRKPNRGQVNVVVQMVVFILAIGLLAVSYRLLGLDYPILAALLAGLAWLIPMAGFVFAAGVAFLAGLASAGADW